MLRGRVVNREGKPLDGVTVQAMNWKGHSSLDWTTKTDAEGRFTWDSAPAEPVLLTLTRARLRHARSARVPGGQG